MRTRILPISSGNGEEYCVDGECDIAVTPPGSFHIGRKAEGLEVAPLGELWWPMYFNGGIAIHGSPSVPPYPASHGCIRIPMYAAPTLYDQVGRGTAVILVGRGPGPEGLAAPPEPPPNPVPASTLPPETDPPTIPTLPPTTAPPDEPVTTTTSTTSIRPPTTTEVTTPEVARRARQLFVEGDDQADEVERGVGHDRRAQAPGLDGQDGQGGAEARPGRP